MGKPFIKTKMGLSLVRRFEQYIRIARGLSGSALKKGWSGSRTESSILIRWRTDLQAIMSPPFMKTRAARSGSALNSDSHRCAANHFAIMERRKVYLDIL